MRNPRRNLLRTVSLCWAAVWGLVWAALTAVSLSPRFHADPSDIFFRTGALVSAWAGLFAWKALQPPQDPKDP